MNTSPIKIGIAGLGRAGWDMHVKELTARGDMFEIVAVSDALPERLSRAREQLGCRTYDHLEDLVTDPGVEIVDIATRSCDHFAHAQLALQAGKLVWLEKPMTLTYDEAMELKRLSDRGPGTLYVRHNRRFEPAFVRIQEIIAQGVLGQVFEIKLRRVSFQRRDDWQTLKAFGGGQLLNWGPHIIDHALCLLGSPVQSLWSDLKQIAAAGDAEDHVHIILTGENGRVVDLEISGGAAIRQPEWLLWGSRGALSCTGKQITLRYIAADYALKDHVANSGTPTAGYGPREKLPWIEETIYANDDGGGMSSICDALYAAVRQGKTYPIGLDQAVAVMRVVSEAKSGTAFAL